MTRINPLLDAESTRQQRNMTTSQKKTNLSVKEGVIVNTFVKDGYDLSDSYNTMLISDDTKMPDKLYEKNTKKNNSLIPITALR